MSVRKSNERNGRKWGREIEEMNVVQNESQNISERTKSGKRKVVFSEKSSLISGFQMYSLKKNINRFYYGGLESVLNEKCHTCTVFPSEADAPDEGSGKLAAACLVFSLLDVEAAEEETGLPIC